MNNIFGYLRHSKELSLKELSDLILIDPLTISKIENNKIEATKFIADKYVKYFGIDYIEFIINSKYTDDAYGVDYFKSLFNIKNKSMEQLLDEMPDLKEVGIKYDKEKLLYHLIPAECLEQLCKVFTFGAKKYGEYNWMKLDNPSIRYCDALERHLIEWKKGNKEDSETGINHLAHIAWNAFALLWFDIKNK